MNEEDGESRKAKANTAKSIGASRTTGEACDQVNYAYAISRINIFVDLREKGPLVLFCSLCDSEHLFKSCVARHHFGYAVVK